jgi:hypothetical protein
MGILIIFEGSRLESFVKTIYELTRFPYLPLIKLTPMESKSQSCKHESPPPVAYIYLNILN